MSWKLQKAQRPIGEALALGSKKFTAIAKGLGSKGVRPVEIIHRRRDDASAESEMVAEMGQTIPRANSPVEGGYQSPRYAHNVLTMCKLRKKP